MDYLIAALNFLLSPITFLFFIFISTPFNHLIYAETQGINTMRLKPSAYVVFCLTAWMMFFMLVVFYNINAPQQVTLVDLLQPRYYWLSIASWFVTLFTLKTYVKGMEGNIMGFIFFPALAVTSLALLLVNISTVITGFNMGGNPLPLTTWPAFLLHGFNPLLVLLFYSNKEKQESQTGVTKLTTNLMAIYTFYGFILALHWIVFKCFSIHFSLSEFFGVGQNAPYFLPLVAGALLHLYYGFSLSSRMGTGHVANLVRSLVFMIAALSIALQFIHYAQYLMRVW